MTVSCPHGHPVELLSAEDVAQRTGRAPGTIRNLAARRGIGTKVGRDYVFAADDVERIRSLRPGRPPQSGIDPSLAASRPAEDGEGGSGNGTKR